MLRRREIIRCLSGITHHDVTYFWVNSTAICTTESGPNSANLPHTLRILGPSIPIQPEWYLPVSAETSGSPHEPLRTLAMTLCVAARIRSGAKLQVHRLIRHVLRPICGGLHLPRLVRTMAMDRSTRIESSRNTRNHRRGLSVAVLGRSVTRALKRFAAPAAISLLALYSRLRACHEDCARYQRQICQCGPA